MFLVEIWRSLIFSKHLTMNEELKPVEIGKILITTTGIFLELSLLECFLSEFFY